MKNIVPDYRLDMVGEPCPYPAVARYPTGWPDNSLSDSKISAYSRCTLRRETFYGITGKNLQRIKEIRQGRLVRRGINLLYNVYRFNFV